MDDPHRLQRFADAQDAGDTFQNAVRELRAGRKVSHWMWFVFPQIAGLGHSEMARRYAISSLPEARAYLAHPVLGPRLIESARALTDLGGRSAREIFGETDATKLRSSMTLFAHAASHETVFQQVLDKYFDGVEDGHTRRRLRSPSARED